MSREIRHGSVDQSVELRIVDATDGTPETAVAAATAGLSIGYRRGNGALVAIAPSNLAAVDSAHADGGLIHRRDGYYRLDLPDAAVAAGATELTVYITATGMVGIAAYHPLVAHDTQDGVRMGLTALPNAVPAAAGGLITRGSADGQITTSSGKVGLESNESRIRETGTAQGGSATTITLAAGASGSTGWYVGSIVRLTGGAGAGQLRTITASDGATKVATVSPAWVTAPAASDSYVIMGHVMPAIDSTGRVTAGTVADKTGYTASIASGGIAATAFAAGAVSADAFAQGAADKVWASATRTLTAFSFAVDISAAAVAAIWNALVTGLTAAGSIGKLIVDNLNATVSSRSSHTPAQTRAEIDASSTRLATIVNTLGAFTGTGLNTVLGFFRALLRKDAALTPTDVGGTFDNTTDSTEAIRDRGDAAWTTGAGGGGGAGSGARTVTFTVTADGVLIEGVSMRMTLGAETYTATTNASGVATFNVNDGTYAWSAAKPGYNGASGSQAVTANHSIAVAITALSSGLPVQPGRSIGYLDCYNGQHALSRGITVEFRLVDSTGAAGQTHPRIPFKAVSDANGRLESYFKPSSSYEGRRDGGQWVAFTAAAGGTFALPGILGRKDE